jgi:hypothetical protein
MKLDVAFVMVKDLSSAEEYIPYMIECVSASDSPEAAAYIHNKYPKACVLSVQSSTEVASRTSDVRRFVALLARFAGPAQTRVANANQPVFRATYVYSKDIYTPTGKVRKPLAPVHRAFLSANSIVDAFRCSLGAGEAICSVTKLTQAQLLAKENTKWAQKIDPTEALAQVAKTFKKLASRYPEQPVFPVEKKASWSDIVVDDRCRKLPEEAFVPFPGESPAAHHSAQFWGKRSPMFKAKNPLVMGEPAPKLYDQPEKYIPLVPVVNRMSFELADLDNGVPANCASLAELEAGGEDDTAKEMQKLNALRDDSDEFEVEESLSTLARITGESPETCSRASIYALKDQGGLPEAVPLIEEFLACEDSEDGTFLEDLITLTESAESAATTDSAETMDDSPEPAYLNNSHNRRNSLFVGCLAVLYCVAFTIFYSHHFHSHPAFLQHAPRFIRWLYGI